jgi:hypothetical protein
MILFAPLFFKLQFDASRTISLQTGKAVRKEFIGVN